MTGASSKQPRTGRFSLEECRELVRLASNGATLEEAAAQLRRPPETIKVKAVTFGIRLKKSAPDINGKLSADSLAPESGTKGNRARELWTLEEDSQLRVSIEKGITARTIASAMQRTTAAIRRRAEVLKLSWRSAKRRESAS